jgi:hypothetical protein
MLRRWLCLLAVLILATVVIAALTRTWAMTLFIAALLWCLPMLGALAWAMEIPLIRNILDRIAWDAVGKMIKLLALSTAVILAVMHLQYLYEVKSYINYRDNANPESDKSQRYTEYKCIVFNHTWYYEGQLVQSER